MVRKIGALIIPLFIVFISMMGSVFGAVTLDDPATSANITSSTHVFDVTSDYNTTNVTNDYIDVWYDNGGTMTLLGSGGWSDVSNDGNRTWNITLTVSGISDGSYTFWVSHRNDNGSNQNSSNSTIVGIDDTGPSKPSCTPTYSRLYIGDRQSYTCTSTDTAFPSDQISMVITSSSDSITSATMTCSGTNPTSCTYNFPDPIRKASIHTVSIVATDPHSQTTSGSTTFSAVEDGAGQRVVGTSQEISTQNKTNMYIGVISLIVLMGGAYFFVIRK